MIKKYQVSSRRSGGTMGTTNRIKNANQWNISVTTGHKFGQIIDNFIAARGKWILHRRVR
jgi:hypothetical protein